MTKRYLYVFVSAVAVLSLLLTGCRQKPSGLHRSMSSRAAFFHKIFDLQVGLSDHLEARFGEVVHTVSGKKVSPGTSTLEVRYFTGFYDPSRPKGDPLTLSFTCHVHIQFLSESEAIFGIDSSDGEWADAITEYIEAVAASMGIDLQMMNVL